MGAAPLKIVLVGDPGVGKSSLFVRWSTGSFSPDSKQHWDPYVTELKRGRRKFRVTLWDTAGSSDWDRIRPLSYPQADVFVVCFSLTSKESLDNVMAKWFKELQHYGPNVRTILVGTKLDLRNKPGQHISPSEGDQLRRYMGAWSYHECSALTGEGVSEAIDGAIKEGMPSALRRKKCTIL